MSEMHKLTSYSDGFGIFNKVAEHEFDVDNKNYLRLFMLNTENKLFNYDELYMNMWNMGHVMSRLLACKSMDFCENKHYCLQKIHILHLLHIWMAS